MFRLRAFLAVSRTAANLIRGMKAIVVEDGSMNWKDVPDPMPKESEIVVDIASTAVNRADLLQRTGKYPPPAGAPPYIGLEAAGRVSAVGSKVCVCRSYIEMTADYVDLVRFRNGKLGMR